MSSSRDGSDPVDPRRTPDDELPDTVAATRAGTGVADGPREPVSLPGYDVGEVIGKGGMGEVLLAHDSRIGRNVAIKRLRGVDPGPAATERFLREAKIQARLDHPAIVPVYELGLDANGQPYFTMKRLAGTTLSDVLRRPEASSQTMLRAFVDVCLAIEFAHSRGVVHRDLKPANIMLGDYGEVYVIDWGIARRIGAPEKAEEMAEPSPSERHTEAGAVLGTPGYMAPEQIEGRDDAGPAADVYALGAILFEILAREPLHPPGVAALASTLGGEFESPSRRKPTSAIAPELDRACSAALDRQPAARPSARELADRVQRYLDGDRDLEQRRKLATEQLLAARAALAAGDRGRAMHASGRALALDPESAAAEFVTQLMLEPPLVPPPELQAELQATDAGDVRRHARRASMAHLAAFPLVPIALWNGVRSWSLFITFLALSFVLSAVTWLIALRPERRMREMVWYAVGNAALVAVLGRVLGPFVFVPPLVCVITMSMMSYPVFALRNRVLVTFILLGWLIPIGLEALGLIPVTWQVVGGALVSSSVVIDVSGSTTNVLVIVTTVAVILVGGFLSGQHARAHLEMKHRLVTQTWHLRRLLPGPAHRVLA